MNKAGKINSIFPEFAIEGGEISIETEDFYASSDGHACVIAGIDATITAASADRVIAVIPAGVDGEVSIQLESELEQSVPHLMKIGKSLVGGMHIVANPAIDPKDDSLILTKSGSRGQKILDPLYRLETDGFLDQMTAEILNPTGIAFNRGGEMYVTNRADGLVCKVERGEVVTVIASGLGVATGLAFDHNDTMFVGDRGGNIYRISEFGTSEKFAELEPSVAAYHIAFGPDGRLFVSSPGLASHDFIYAVDKSGKVERYARGFGRPQGIAFDVEGNLYAAACYKGRHGIVRVDANTQKIETIVAGNRLVGLCFTRNREMIVATNEAVYSIPAGIEGFLLNR